jgi:selenocysteine-specific elongation factor
MLAVYEAAGLQPPQPDNFQANLPRDVNVRTILGMLVEEGRLVYLAPDIYLPPFEVEKVKPVVKRLAEEPGGVTVANLRDATGSSRKIILPLLEYFDAKRWTRRQGDTRVWVDETEGKSQ